MEKRLFSQRNRPILILFNFCTMIISVLICLTYSSVCFPHITRYTSSCIFNNTDGDDCIIPPFSKIEFSSHLSDNFTKKRAGTVFLSRYEIGNEECREELVGVFLGNKNYSYELGNLQTYLIRAQENGIKNRNFQITISHSTIFGIPTQLLLLLFLIFPLIFLFVILFFFL